MEDVRLRARRVVDTGGQGVSRSLRALIAVPGTVGGRARKPIDAVIDGETERLAEPIRGAEGEGVQSDFTVDVGGRGAAILVALVLCRQLLPFEQEL